MLGTVTSQPATIQNVAAAIVARAHLLSLTSVAFVPVDDQTPTQFLVDQIQTITSPLGITISSLTNVSDLSATELISSNSGMVVLATCGVSLTDDIVNTWSVLENAEKPVLGVILADSAN